MEEKAQSGLQEASGNQTSSLIFSGHVILFRVQLYTKATGSDWFLHVFKQETGAAKSPNSLTMSEAGCTFHFFNHKKANTVK